MAKTSMIVFVTNEDDHCLEQNFCITCPHNPRFRKVTFLIENVNTIPIALGSKYIAKKYKSVQKDR